MLRNQELSGFLFNNFTENFIQAGSFVTSVWNITENFIQAGSFVTSVWNIKKTIKWLKFLIFFGDATLLL